MAALAGLDRNILRVAGRKSKEMEMATTLDESSGMEGTFLKEHWIDPKYRLLGRLWSL